MTDWADVPIPGLDQPDTGLNVASICQGRVQRCPTCSAPVVYAMTVTDGKLRPLTVHPETDPKGNVILTTTIPGNLHAYLARTDDTRPRFALHHCPNARPATTRRIPNGPTQH